MGRITETVKALIIVNVIFYIGSHLIGSNAFDYLSIWFPENNNFRYWQIFTHMFMHHPTFYMHIVFNMLGLWMFGTPLEKMWGRNRFLFFYFSSGLGAVILPYIIDYYTFNSVLSSLTEAGYNAESIVSLLNEGKFMPSWADVIGQGKLDSFTQIFMTNSLGASGAIMGLLVAFGISFPNAKLMLIFLPIPIKAKYFIPVLLGYEIISGFTGGVSVFGVNVGHWAHVGGALFGLIMAWYWKKNSFNNKRWN